MKKTHAKRGVTLTELLVAVAISAVVLAAMCTALVTHVTQQRQMRRLTEMRQNAHAAALLLGRDIRMAGYGLPVRPAQVASWITWVGGLGDAVHVAQGAGGAPDRVFLSGAFDQPSAFTAAACNPSDIMIRLQSGQGALFNTTTRKLIFLGREELARITAIAGDQLTVSTDSAIDGRGLKYAYDAGASVELVEVVEYGCVNSMTNALRRPYLYRDNHQGTLTNRLQQLAVLGIADLQITQTGNSLQFTITGIAEDPERGYTDPVHGDAYRRVVVEGAAQRRNPPP